MLAVLGDGIASGCAYGLLALSMVFVYRTTSTLNYAHGEMATFSTYIMYYFSKT
jgi:branched-chain amino acid transport system permease protein